MKPYTDGLMKHGTEVEDWDSINVLELRPSAEHRSSL